MLIVISGIVFSMYAWAKLVGLLLAAITTHLPESLTGAVSRMKVFVALVYFVTGSSKPLHNRPAYEVKEECRFPLISTDQKITWSEYLIK